jgi:hypothetical protein
MNRIPVFRSVVAALVLFAVATLAPAAKAQFIFPTSFATGSYSTLNFKVTSATATPTTPDAHGEVILTKASNGNNYIGLLVYEQLDGLGNIAITVKGRTATGGWITATKIVPDTFDNRVYWMQDYLRGVTYMLGGPLPSVSVGTFWAEMIDPALYDTTH